MKDESSDEEHEYLYSAGEEAKAEVDMMESIVHETEEADGESIDYGTADSISRLAEAEWMMEVVAKGKKITNEHWNYIEGLCKKMYKDAFFHGYKHGLDEGMRRGVDK